LQQTKITNKAQNNGCFEEQRKCKEKGNVWAKVPLSGSYFILPGEAPSFQTLAHREMEK